MDVLVLWWFLLLVVKVVVGVVLVGLIGFVGLPLILAGITRLRNNNRKNDPSISSSLYVGRVWHTRLQPKVHGFHYPLFVFAIDLEEVDDLFSNRLWPLSLLVTFRNSDHLKNGEGKQRKRQQQHQQKQQDEADADCDEADEKCEIANRVLRMIATKTNNKFRPTLAAHRVICVTHLCYYGYCFNPVSFYYIQQKGDNKLDAVVAEVSNTPWNEMHCYVLHPDSIDEVVVQQRKVEDDDDDDDGGKNKADLSSSQEIINYKWPKRFHVSPFMEMHYIYDWTFTNFQLQDKENKLKGIENDPLLVRASMKRRLPKQQRQQQQQQQQDGGEKEQVTDFTAKVVCERRGIHPYSIAWQLIYYPIYCFIIQIWIHYEAFWLFVKGITFVPHPNDTETAISAAIGAIMIPLFAFKDWFDIHVMGKSKSSSSSSTTTTAGRAAATANSGDDKSKQE